jgi:triosephosphate isomerase
MIFVNFKTYEEGTGEKAINLARICQKVCSESQVPIFPCVQAVDVFRLASQKFKVWAQHVDDISFGANTGQVLPEAVLAAGARGTLLNHSENKLPVEVIGSIITKLRNQGTGDSAIFKILVCAGSLEEAKEIAKLRPDMIAYEPPELIGNRQLSVSSEKPDLIKKLTEEIKEVPLLIGAGVHSKKDVEVGLGLGAKGILVATDVVKAEDPERELADLAAGFKL